MSRSSTHRIRCSQCPALVELTMTGLTFCDQAKRYVEAIAVKEGWSVSPVGCPQHAKAKEAANA